MKTCLLAALALLLGLGRYTAAVGAEVDRQAIVSALREQERAIQSAVIDYSVAVMPTRPDQIPRLREAMERPSAFNPGGLQAFIVSDWYVAANSHKIRWWWHGLKERVDRAPLFPSKKERSAMVAAFDGEVTRSFDVVPPQSPTPADGYVSLAKTDPDPGVTRSGENPLSLTFRSYRQPLSKLVEQGRELEIDHVADAGGDLTRVSFTHDQPLRLRLYLDRDFHPVKREVDVLDPIFFQIPGQPVAAWSKRNPRPHTEISVFASSHYTAADGKRIWFPRKVILHYFLGKAKDGTLVPWSEKLFTFDDAKFNVPIADETFAPEFPQGARVHESTVFPVAKAEDYSVDPKSDIDRALIAARRENKRVLIEFGGNWCHPCLPLHQLLTKGYILPPLVKAGFVLVHVDARENHEFFERYAKDVKVGGVPVLTVLDSDGNVVGNAKGSQLKNDSATIADFLQNCRPSK